MRRSLALLSLVAVACQEAPAAHAPTATTASVAAPPPVASSAASVPPPPAPAKVTACIPAGKLTRWRYHLALAMTYTGEILATGGHQHDSGKELTDVDSFNEGSKTWTKAAPLPTARARHIAIPDQSFHQIIVAAGNAESVEAFGAPNEDRKWTKVGKAYKDAYGAQAFMLSSGMFVVGGDRMWKGSVNSDTFELWPVPRKHTPMPSPRSDAQVVIEGNRVTLVGGHTTDGKKPEQDLVFDGITKTWTESRDAKLDYLRELDKLGEALWLDPYAPDLFVTTEAVYRFSHGKWEKRATLATSHAGGAAIKLSDKRNDKDEVLPSNKVLVVGGIDEAHAAAEICDAGPT